MLAFAAKRLGIALLVALTVSLITFSMIYVSGDPAIAIAGEGARPADIEAIRKFYGFDRPIVDNSTEQNRALNRRVQFIRTEGVKEGCPKTGVNP